ncbi:hypothetical protein AXA44_42855 [Rhodococcus sp. SC4]|nr:hypothetical protein AXA44_42855 [Rhodococcus sp. SC4]
MDAARAYRGERIEHRLHAGITCRSLVAEERGDLRKHQAPIASAVTEPRPLLAAASASEVQIDTTAPGAHSIAGVIDANQDPFLLALCASVGAFQSG